MSGVALPLASLLPPSEDAPSPTLPLHSAVLGPLPATAPLHAALSYIKTADLPLFNSTAVQPRARALIVTGPRSDFHSALEEAGSPWLAAHGGDRVVLDALQRVDVRYCPSADHARLLLTLLTPEPGVQAREAHELVGTPGLVVLYDLAGLFLAEEQQDENEPSGENKHMDDRPAEDVQVATGAVKLKATTTAARYVELISAALATTRHVSRSGAPAGLLVLEPRGDGLAFPILPIDGSRATNVPQASRDRRVGLGEGLQRLLGRESVVVIKGGLPGKAWLMEDMGEEQFELQLGEEKHALRRDKCASAEFAAPPREDGVRDESGWEWKWGKRPA